MRNLFASGFATSDPLLQYRDAMYTSHPTPIKHKQPLSVIVVGVAYVRCRYDKR
jgi:hypothetical protein